MPETIWGGYLRAQQQEQQQEELAEEKKRKKLEESLSQLQMKQTGRQMERDVEEFKYQQRMRRELDEALKQLTPEELKKYRFGIPLPKLEEAKAPKEYEFERDVGRVSDYFRQQEEGVFGPPTPPELLRGKAGDIVAEKRFPALRVAEPKTPKPMTSASYRSQASSLEAQAGKSIDVTEQKALFERAKTLREEANKLFRQEQQRAGMIPDVPFTPEEGGEHPEEDAYIQQVESYLSDYDIDWDVIADSHPNWDIEYMKTKLGQ